MIIFPISYEILEMRFYFKMFSMFIRAFSTAQVKLLLSLLLIYLSIFIFSIFIILLSI